MTKWLTCFQFMRLAWRGYWAAYSTGDPQYIAILQHRIPSVCFYVAVGREAWRVSQIAVESFKKKP